MTAIIRATATGTLALALTAPQAPPSAPTLPPPFATTLGAPERVLPVRVTTATARGGQADGAKVRLTVTVEAVDRGTRLTVLTATLLDVARLQPIATGVAPPGTLNDLPVRLTLAVAPGSYLLRVAATDSSGRPGSVESLVDAGLTTAGTLRLGTLNLGLAAAPPPAPAIRGGRGEIATPVPLPRLQFSNEPNAVAFFDLYGGTANERVTVLFEIRRRPDGPPVALLQPTIQPARLGEPDHYLVTAPIDLASISPGDYEVRATVSAAGQPAGIITRTLRKVKSA